MRILCHFLSYFFLIRYLLLENRAAGRTHSVTRGVHIFEKPCCREIRAMGGRVMRGLPVSAKRISM